MIESQQDMLVGCKTPLVDLLRRIPTDELLRWQEKDGLQAHCSTPIGQLVHEAADELTRLTMLIETKDAALKRLSNSFTGGWAGMYRERVEIIAEVEQIAKAALSQQVGESQKEQSNA